VGALLGYYALLRERPDGAYWVQLVLGCTWAADTGAYLVGRRWGRTKLAPTLSPGKSVEGALGGLAGATGLAIVVALLAPGPGRAPPVLVGLGLLVGVAGLTGDLVESWIKRQLGAKDASGLLLGHGGLLDRMDSLLAAGMVAYYYLATVGW
jgi:phosphatidate cytidylyltransferase